MPLGTSLHRKLIIFVQLSLIPGNDYKIVFLPGEQFGELQPKPAGSARNQGNFFCFSWF